MQVVPQESLGDHGLRVADLSHVRGLAEGAHQAVAERAVDADASEGASVSRTGYFSFELYWLVKPCREPYLWGPYFSP